MLEKDRKRCLVIESVLDGKGTKSRSIGFQARLQEAGLFSSNLFVQHDLAIELNAYRKVMSALNNEGFHFDAAFCETDNIAYGVLLACQDFGLRVPEDFSIVGFDDLLEGAGNITTIKQDLDSITNAVIELLSEAREQKPERNIMIPVNLVARGTT